MEATLDAFKGHQAKSLEILKKLQSFLEHGEGVGVPIDASVKAKVMAAVQDVAGDKLKIALIGGFSEGKTSIVAAWMEKLDQASMKISQQESSNEVKTYNVGSDFVLIDTPGLFGFKEKCNAETQAVEKYKEITKQYVSEAHLVLYVMNSTNPIKESHKDDLVWLFRTLNLLPRTVFVLSRFDEVADVEDDGQYQHHLAVKKNNVQDRLCDLINLTDEEKSELSIVAVSANPFDMGAEHWLSDLEQFKTLSRIASLQHATTQKVKTSGGASSIVKETKHSVIRDVLHKQLPIAIANDDKIGQEVEKLEGVSVTLEQQLASTKGRIVEVRASLRDFVNILFPDLILQAKAATMETIGEFVERKIGNEGMVLNGRIQSEFERQLETVNLEVSQMKVSFQSEISHFNSAVNTLGKQGLDYAIKSKLITNSTVLATRDGIVNVAKIIGVDLGQVLKFKPWGAMSLAKGLNGVLAVAGLALELWDSWDKSRKEEAFRKSIGQLTQNFQEQQKELLVLLDAPEFVEKFFPDFVALQQSVQVAQKDMQERRAQRQRFHDWRREGETIDAEFKMIYA